MRWWRRLDAWMGRHRLLSCLLTGLAVACFVLATGGGPGQAASRGTATVVVSYLAMMWGAMARGDDGRRARRARGLPADPPDERPGEPTG